MDFESQLLAELNKTLVEPESKETMVQERPTWRPKSTKRRAECYTETEKQNLLLAMKTHGIYDIDKLHEAVPNKSKHLLTSYLTNARYRGANWRKPQEVMIIDEWLKQAETSSKWTHMNFTQREILPNVLHLIADLEHHPSPEMCNGIDYRQLYHAMSDMMSGMAPHGLNKPTKMFLLQTVEWMNNIKRTYPFTSYEAFINASKTYGMHGSTKDVRPEGEFWNPFQVPLNLLQENFEDYLALWPILVGQSTSDNNSQTGNLSSKSQGINSRSHESSNPTPSSSEITSKDLETPGASSNSDTSSFTRKSSTAISSQNIPATKHRTRSKKRTRRRTRSKSSNIDNCTASSSATRTAKTSKRARSQTTPTLSNATVKISGRSACDATPSTCTVISSSETSATTQLENLESDEKVIHSNDLPKSLDIPPSIENHVVDIDKLFKTSIPANRHVLPKVKKRIPGKKKTLKRAAETLIALDNAKIQKTKVFIHNNSQTRRRQLRSRTVHTTTLAEASTNKNQDTSLDTHVPWRGNFTQQIHPGSSKTTRTSTPSLEATATLENKEENIQTSKKGTHSSLLKSLLVSHKSDRPVVNPNSSLSTPVSQDHNAAAAQEHTRAKKITQSKQKNVVAQMQKPEVVAPSEDKKLKVTPVKLGDIATSSKRAVRKPAILTTRSQATTTKCVPWRFTNSTPIQVDITPPAKLTVVESSSHKLRGHCDKVDSVSPTTNQQETIPATRQVRTSKRKQVLLSRSSVTSPEPTKVPQTCSAAPKERQTRRTT